MAPLSEGNSGNASQITFDKTLAKTVLTEASFGKEKEGQKSKTALYLCDWRMPPKFLLTVSSESPVSNESPPPQPINTCDPKKGKLFTFTETVQYVDDLDAYVRLDKASGRHFLGILGNRRIVLQIIPAKH